MSLKALATVVINIFVIKATVIPSLVVPVVASQSLPGKHCFKQKHNSWRIHS